MRNVLVSMLLVTMMVAVASAELLTTANPLGQGKWAVEGFGVQDSNINNISNDWKMTAVGAYGGYGITDKLDVFVSAGSASLSGQPAVLGTATGTVIGVNGKYAVMDEESGSPVSVAVGLGYRSLPITHSTVLMGPDYTLTQMALGVGVSKIFVPFVPYAALSYRSNAMSIGGGNGDTTQLDITVGTAIAWSMQGAVLVEYTSQSMTPKVGATYSMPQMAVGVSYRI